MKISKDERIQLLKNLKNLEKRALHSNIEEFGSDSVVIFLTELSAIDDAIKLLDPELYCNPNKIEIINL